MRCVLACVLVALAACASDPPLSGPMNSLEVTLTYSSEGSYLELAIDGLSVKYTRNKGTSADVSPVANVPHWTKDDLVTSNAMLTDSEREDLERTIRSSGFLDLPERTGAGPGERAYPTLIRVEGRWVNKEVRYFSGQASPPRPEAFKALEDKLEELRKKKFPAG